MADRGLQVAHGAQRRHRPQARGLRLPHLALVRVQAIFLGDFPCCFWLILGGKWQGGRNARPRYHRCAFCSPSLFLAIFLPHFAPHFTTDHSCLGRRMDVSFTHYTAHDALAFSQSFPDGVADSMAAPQPLCLSCEFNSSSVPRTEFPAFKASHGTVRARAVYCAFDSRGSTVLRDCLCLWRPSERLLAICGGLLGEIACGCSCCTTPWAGGSGEGR